MIPRVTHLFAVLFLSGLLLVAGPRTIWLDVPFIRQEKDGCGAASIVMVMRYWLKQQEKPAERSVEPAEIQRALYSSEAHGIYASELKQYLQQHGFRSFAFKGTWDDLNEQLEKGRPLIVALKASAGQLPLHYVVVAGLSWEESIVLLNDPSRRKLLKQDRLSFEKEWRAAGQWTLLALPEPQVR